MPATLAITIRIMRGALLGLFLISPFARAMSPLNCDILLLSPPFVHEISSGRSLRELGQESPALSTLVNHAIHGRQNILSLGEGRSTIISDAIAARTKSGGPTEGLVAFDFAYPAHTENGTLTETRDPGAMGTDHSYWAPAEALVKTHPKNFVSGTFQALDLRDAKGNRQRFDVVYSAYSLNFVMHELDPQQKAAQLRKILDHVTPGGTLVFYPTLISGTHLESILETLKSEGLVASYGSVNTLTAVIRKTK